MSSRANRWTTRAVTRLVEIGALIAKEKPDAAATVVAGRVAAVDALAIYPAVGLLAGSLEPESWLPRACPTSSLMASRPTAWTC